VFKVFIKVALKAKAVFKEDNKDLKGEGGLFAKLNL
jgi:hypothetical protein